MAQGVKERCGICGDEFFTLESARDCERKGYLNAKGITIGGKVVMSGGDGHQELEVTGFETYPHSHEVHMVTCGQSKFNIRYVESVQ